MRAKRIAFMLALVMAMTVVNAGAALAWHPVEGTPGVVCITETGQYEVTISLTNPEASWNRGYVMDIHETEGDFSGLKWSKNPVERGGTTEAKLIIDGSTAGEFKLRTKVSWSNEERSGVDRQWSDWMTFKLAGDCEKPVEPVYDWGHSVDEPVCVVPLNTEWNVDVTVSNGSKSTADMKVGKTVVTPGNSTVLTFSGIGHDDVMAGFTVSFIADDALAIAVDLILEAPEDGCTPPPPEVCEYDPQLPADDPDCVPPPEVCPYDEELTIEDEDCLPPPPPETAPPGVISGCTDEGVHSAYASVPEQYVGEISYDEGATWNTFYIDVSWSGNAWVRALNPETGLYSKVMKVDGESCKPPPPDSCEYDETLGVDDPGCVETDIIPIINVETESMTAFDVMFSLFALMLMALGTALGLSTLFRRSQPQPAKYRYRHHQ